MAKLGQLYLQRGRWGDEQLIPAAYVDEATSVQVPSPNEDKVDWSQGYGYCFWMARHGYRGDGAFGQFCIVLPEHDAVIAITGGTEAMQEVVDHVWEHLLPGLGGSSIDDSAEDRLAERLRSLGLPPCEDGPCAVEPFGRGRPRPGSSHLLGRRGRRRPARASRRPSPTTR